MEFVKHVAVILFIIICILKLLPFMRLPKNEKGTEMNLIKENC